MAPEKENQESKTKSGGPSTNTTNDALPAHWEIDPEEQDYYLDSAVMKLESGFHRQCAFRFMEIAKELGKSNSKPDKIEAIAIVNVAKYHLRQSEHLRKKIRIRELEEN